MNIKKLWRTQIKFFENDEIEEIKLDIMSCMSFFDIAKKYKRTQYEIYKKLNDVGIKLGFKCISWSSEEKKRLGDEVEEGKTVEEISTLHMRSSKHIKDKIEKWFNDGSEMKASTGTMWSKEDIKKLEEEYNKHTDLKEIAKMLNRTYGGVRRKIKREIDPDCYTKHPTENQLNKIKSGEIDDEFLNRGQPWSIQEDEQLKEEYNRKLSVKEIAKIHKRNCGGISSRIKKKILNDDSKSSKTEDISYVYDEEKKDYVEKIITSKKPKTEPPKIESNFTQNEQIQFKNNFEAEIKCLLKTDFKHKTRNDLLKQYKILLSLDQTVLIRKLDDINNLLKLFKKINYL